MALVAYDSSDCSDYEDVDNENASITTLNTKAKGYTPTKHMSLDPESPIAAPSVLDNQEEGTSLFNLLPQPSTKRPAVIEEDDEFLHKKVENLPKPRAKITVPSLNDFKDVEHSIPIARPKASNGKKSGLLSMLPQPRNAVTATTKSLIPHVLTKQPNSTVKKDLPKSIQLKKPKINSKPISNSYSDESDNEEVENDFFSINKIVEIPEHVEEHPETDAQSDTLSVSKPRGIESFFKKDVPLEPDFVEPYESEASSSNNGYGSENNSNDVVLDEEAIMKLCGTRGKRKREDIQIVDVNQQEVLADAREWLLKGLMDDTTKRVSASKKKGHEPTTQQKRKHQITYLAYQAKANEAELQNQWANSRMSKRQTQAKYGF